jgi:hypothetical protein
MRQIVYVSLSSVPDDGADISAILNQSRHNNAIDGITGLLWSDGKSYLQAIEGPRVSVIIILLCCLIAPSPSTSSDRGTWFIVVLTKRLPSTIPKCGDCYIKLRMEFALIS